MPEYDFEHSLGVAITVGIAMVIMGLWLFFGCGDESGLSIIAFPFKAGACFLGSSVIFYLLDKVHVFLKTWKITSDRYARFVDKVNCVVMCAICFLGTYVSPYFAGYLNGVLLVSIFFLSFLGFFYFIVVGVDKSPTYYEDEEYLEDSTENSADSNLGE